MSYAQRLSIGGAWMDAYLTKDSLKHTNNRGPEPDSLSFSLIVDAPEPAISSEVLYYLPGEADPVFGGVVASAPTLSVGNEGVSYDVRCVDFRVQMDAKRLNDRWVGLTAGAILVLAFAKYAPQFDTSLIDLGGPVIPSVTFRRDGTLSDMLELFSRVTGYVWDVTPTKKILWGPPTSQACPFSIGDGTLNFENLVVTPSRDGLATVIYVKGRPQPSSVSTLNTFPGDGLTSSFRLTGTPYGLDNYNTLAGDFPRGIDLATWAVVDANNPAPPAGHIPSDGYLFTTLQQGPSLAESGWLQVVGGTGTWGQVYLQSLNAYPRGTGRMRYEWEVSITASAKDGMLGLWDAANQAAQGGVRYGFAFDAASGQIKPWADGAVRTAAATITYAATDELRCRVIPKAGSGALLYVNKDALNGYPSSSWQLLLDTNLGSWTTWVVCAVFSKNFEARVRRVRAFNPLYNMTLTVAGVAKTVGLLGVDVDAGVDALVGVNADVPVLSFFADTIPLAVQEVSLTYYEAVPTSVRVPDDLAIAALKAIENPTDDPLGADGIVEDVIYDDKIDNTRMAQYVGIQALEERANFEIQLAFDTYTPGARAGQVINTAMTPAGSGRTLSRAFMIQSVNMEPVGLSDHRFSITATTRLRGIDGLFISLLKRLDIVPQFADQDGPLEEFLNGTGRATLSDAGTMVGPSILGTGTLSIGDTGAMVAGPDPLGVYLYGVGTFGGAVMA